MMGRFFSWRQKNEIFIRANGLCELCGDPLGENWHCDHIVPDSKGGKTIVENAQALCAHCNLAKGTTVITLREPGDSIELRKAQEEIENVGLAKIQRGEKSMTCILACGSGKTLGALNFCNTLYRKGIADGAIVLTPRKALCEQYQDAWSGKGDDEDFSQYYNDPKMSKIYYRENKTPILFREDFGYSLIYNSLVSDSKTKKPLHTSDQGIVQRKFVLVLDEAQALSKAEELAFTSAVLPLHNHPNCVFTIVMSATPIRSDRLELFCGEYTEPDKNGRRYLKADVVYDYKDGVDEGYLRPFEFHLEKAQLDIEQWIDSSDEILTLYSDEKKSSKKLLKFMRQDVVWKHLVDKTIDQLLAIRGRYWPGYKALLAAIDVKHAGLISKYIEGNEKYKNLKTLTVVGDINAILEDPDIDGHGELSGNLDRFKNGNYDILISVRMAYVGFNHPPISAVGVLTHWRFRSFLEQLIGRGGRIFKNRPKDEQVLRVIGLDDPAMAKFAEDMRESTLSYLIETGERKPLLEDDEQDVIEQQPIEFIVNTALHGMRAIGYNSKGDLSREEYSGLENQMRSKNLNGLPPTMIKQVIIESGGNIDVFLGVANSVQVKNFRDDVDVDRLRSGIEEMSRQLAGWHMKLGHDSDWNSAKNRISSTYFPNGIDKFYLGFNSQEEYKNGLLNIVAMLNSEILNCKAALKSLKAKKDDGRK